MALGAAVGGVVSEMYSPRIGLAMLPIMIFFGLLILTIGREESESAVITTGPITPVEFIMDESKAYAVLKYESGTMSFHKGRTERLIGGAVIPRIKAVIKIDLLVSIVLRMTIKPEYIGTKIRIGHF